MLDEARLAPIKTIGHRRAAGHTTGRQAGMRHVEAILADYFDLHQRAGVASDAARAA